MSQLKLEVASTLELALQKLLHEAMPGDDQSPLLLLPSTLTQNDVVATTSRDVLWELGIDASIFTPGAQRLRLLSLMRPVGTDPAWKQIAIDRHDVDLATVTLPTVLRDARRRMLVCDLDRVAIRGPFFLDLIGRYLHPRDRVRLLSSEARQQSLAEVNLALPGSIALLRMSISTGALVAITTDLILAELAALALSELMIGSERSFTGPWEDAVVQRACELQLGIAVPSEIVITWMPDLESIEPVRSHLVERLGLLNS